MNNRVSREKLFITIATLMAQRSTCERLQVGAVVVQDKRIVSTGYGGSPSGESHCIDVGCQLGPVGECIRTIHAEANTIAFAAKWGVALAGSTMYVTHAPCFNCAKLIINAGISKVVYRHPYRDTSGVELLLKRGVPVELFFDEDLD